jgi:valine dehydrogenase (NAD+)
MLTDPWADFDEHERVVVARDPESGVAMVIALHSTVLGPALGGTRMNAYADQGVPRAAAYSDALRLARAMTLKNSLAGLDHGGGKAVIVTDPAQGTPDLLRAYGRLVSTLDGAYVTAGDVGVSVEDLDVISETCRWTTGRSPEKGGLGDSAILTAVGVLAGMRATVEVAMGAGSFDGLTVGIVGLGKVGGRLAQHLTQAGAVVVGYDPSPQAREHTLDTCPGALLLGSLDEILAAELDVLSPNALGGLITADLAATTSARVICGAANNQLASPDVADLLPGRGITYAPDFMVNCGGVIQISQEYTQGTFEQARVQAEAVYDTTRRVLERARSQGVTPVAAAEAEALDRIRARGAEPGAVV